MSRSIRCGVAHACSNPTARLRLDAVGRLASGLTAVGRLVAVRQLASGLDGLMQSDGCAEFGECAV